MSLFAHLRELLARVVHRLDEAAKDAETDLLEEVKKHLEPADGEMEAFILQLKTWSAEHPQEIFTILREIQPIVVRKDFVLVTRFEDVEAVLSRDDVFDVQYAEKMKLLTDGENFFLGMRDTPRYTRDQANMRGVVRRDDISVRISSFIAEQASSLVAAAGGQLEVVSGLTQRVPARFVGDYFGLPGPSERQLIDWTATLFWFLFLDTATDSALRTRALAASAMLNGYVDGVLSSRKRQPTGRDDIVLRCLALQTAGVPGMTNLDIRNNLIGLIIGAIPTVASVCALALDELLRRPDQLEIAQSAAVAGNDELLTRSVFEAMRFNPFAPGIFRTANQAFTLAKGERRETQIAAGSTVVAATQSAMFDRLRIDDPKEFRLDRSPRDGLHFGYGLHSCFGQHINRVQIPQILKPLLARPNLRRADGDAGQLHKAGPYPSSLTVLFD